MARTERFFWESKMSDDFSFDTTRVKKRGILTDLFAGYLMGIAFIIPGFSGGSVAAIVGVYDRLISAITNIFRDFKNSIKTLLPIGIGLLLGAASLLYPLKLALGFAPLPTVSLFVGLALGGTVTLTERLRGRLSVWNAIALLIPLLLAGGLCFIPTGADVDLFALSAHEYLLLFLVGLIGSSALVIPGISGSMLLLIFGYYNPIIRLVTDHILKGEDVGASLLVLSVTAMGIAAGFFLVSFLMRWLLDRFPRGTYFAIVGFILGSVPAAFVSTAKEAGMTINTLPSSVIHWVACATLFLVGFAGALSFTIAVKRRKEK